MTLAYPQIAASPTGIALPDSRSWLGPSACLIGLFLWLHSNPLSQVAIQEMRVECREQSLVLMSESGVLLTDESGRYLVADKKRQQCQPLVG